ncbi:MAG: cysteine dioxygenase family protein [Acidobacteriota bacterium]
MFKTQVRGLAAVRDELLAIPHPFTRDAVERVVRGLRPTREELEPYIQFSPSGYTRTGFYHGPRFEILVLCWKDGQCSPIHDHASSICSMAVVEGVCSTETYTLPGEQRASAVVPGESVSLSRTARGLFQRGEVVTVVGGDIHRVGNLQGDGADLVTVHVYLPAIASMRCFDEQTGLCSVTAAVTLPPRS